MTLKSVAVQGVALFFAWPMPTQEPSQPLTLREVVEIVADYDVRHSYVPDATPYWGLTDYERRTMFLVTNGDLTTRRQAALHELIHIGRRMRGQQAATRDEEEVLVQTATLKLYQELFGQ